MSSTLSNCAFNHSKLENLFQKKQAPHVHTHHPRHTYAHHDHTHSHVHAKVYKCTHYGRKGHLVKFCFDKVNSINVVNNNVWVSFDANLRRLKRKWVPKFSPLVFDIGAGYHMTWEIWCLYGGWVSSSNASTIMAPYLSRHVRAHIYVKHKRWEFWYPFSFESTGVSIIRNPNILFVKFIWFILSK